MVLGPAIAATSSAADMSFSPPAPAADAAPAFTPGPAIVVTSSAADVGPHNAGPVAADSTQTLGPAVVATSSAADVSLSSPSATPVSGFAPTQALFEAPISPASAPAMLFGAQTPQLSPSLIISAETATAGGTTLTLGPANAAGSSAMLPVASVFSSDPGPGLGGSGTGQIAGSSDLPFMDDSGAGDTPIYTASDETPWIFVSDFGGDWFFV